MKKLNKATLLGLGLAALLNFSSRCEAMTDEDFINYSVEFQNTFIQSGDDEAKMKADQAAINKKYGVGSAEWKAYEAALMKDKPRFNRLMETIQEKATESLMNEINKGMEE